jgi:hypothetical protein
LRQGAAILLPSGKLIIRTVSTVSFLLNISTTSEIEDNTHLQALLFLKRIQKRSSNGCPTRKGTFKEEKM